MERHFTVSGFVAQGGRTALHWHRLGMWLPAGGHLEPNEDPIEAVLREVKEETGFDAEIVPTQFRGDWEHPPQLTPPVTIGVYDIEHGDPHQREAHQHIDFIYFTRPTAGQPLDLPAEDGWVWLDEASLQPGAVLMRPDGSGEAPIKEDVRILGLAAIAVVGELEGLEALQAIDAIGGGEG